MSETATILKLKIERFRGIEALDWNPAPGMEPAAAMDIFLTAFADIPDPRADNARHVLTRAEQSSTSFGMRCAINRVRQANTR